MGKKYIYADEKSIIEIDKVLQLASEITESDQVVITNKKTVPPLVGAAMGGVAASAFTGVGGTAVATSTLTGIGGVSLIGGTAATASAVVAFPIALLAGGTYLFFKNKKEKEMHNKRLARYKEAVSKQSMVIKKFIEMDKQREKYEKNLMRNNENIKKENTKLKNKLNELRAINESLLTIIDGLSKDLQLA